ncbi:MAG: hypothetical protein XD78_1637 [Desulfotomaculum sp. 46_296]|nr:MAG: hypothetical protein XD78_1637 [Desulfotomaculum sp. 46_296]
MVSARIRTQAYTAVVCMAVLSLTVLPLAVPPKKKLYVLPYRLFLGLARGFNKADKIGIFINVSPESRHEKSTAYAMLLILKSRFVR